jgi:hypothetical protein
MTPDPGLGKTYRLSRTFLWTGVLCTPLFLAMGVGSVWAALANPDGSFRYPVETALIFACFWGAFTLLGVSLIRAYLRERLEVSAEWVRMVGLFRTREVRLADVWRAEWKGAGGRLVLRGPDTRVVIWLPNYSRAEQAELREFFRRALPTDIQEGWERHEQLWVPTPEKVAAAVRARRWIYVVLLVMGVGLVGFGAWDPLNDPALRWQNLIFGNLSVAFGIAGLLRKRPPTDPAPAGTMPS